MEMTLKGDGWKVHVGPCDETGKNAAAAGVGVMWKEEEVSVYPEPIRDEELATAKEAGRVGK